MRTCRQTLLRLRQFRRHPRVIDLMGQARDQALIVHDRKSGRELAGTSPGAVRAVMRLPPSEFGDNSYRLSRDMEKTLHRRQCRGRSEDHRRRSPLGLESRLDAQSLHILETLQDLGFPLSQSTSRASTIAVHHTVRERLRDLPTLHRRYRLLPVRGLESGRLRAGATR